MTHTQRQHDNARDDALTDRLRADAASARPDADADLRDRIIDAVDRTEQAAATGHEGWYLGAWISTSLGIAAALAIAAGVWLWGQSATETPMPAPASGTGVVTAGAESADASAEPLVVMLDDLFTDSTTAADALVTRQYEQEWRAVADDTRAAGLIFAGALLEPTDP